MKIAYFSPLNPQRSGISECSEELLPYLQQRMDVDVFTSEKTIENKEIEENFNVYSLEHYKDAQVRAQYDLAVFQMGNDYKKHNKIAEIFFQYGGILELHDVAMHHYVAQETIVKGKREQYLKIMEYCHGNPGKRAAQAFLAGQSEPLWESQSMKYTVNKHFIDRAQAVIVHSDFAKQIVKGVNKKVKVANIPLHTAKIYDDFNKQKKESRKKLQIDEKQLVFGTFGFMSANKRIEQIMEALRLYKKSNRFFQFFIVGSVSQFDVGKKAKELGLQENVVETGYVNLEDFDHYMQACDIVFNLRYPTQGESSASLHRLLGMGKAVVVTDIGTFREYPDDIVYKVSYGPKEVESIFRTIQKLTVQKEKLPIIGKKMIAYAKHNFSRTENAVKYEQFFKAILKNNWKEKGIDYLLDQIFEIGMLHPQYLEHFKSRMI